MNGFSGKDYPVVIGIDFGTTFSGAAFAFTLAEDGRTPDIIDILKWPRSPGSYPKTATTLLYQTSPAIEAPIDWAESANEKFRNPRIARTHQLVSRFKLFLDESLASNPSSPRVLPVLPPGKTVVDVIADYLRCLHKYLMLQLGRTFARNYAEDSFRYCLTVPAMWSDQAKTAMRQAAVQAGLIKATDHHDRLLLISEPEAAAIYCENRSDDYSVKPGDRFMICDCGGGTVDLIVFELVEENFPGNGENDVYAGLNRSPPGPRRRLKEVTKGQGLSVGGLFIDQRFREFLERKFASVNISPTKNAMDHMVEYFVDKLKPSFDGVQEQFLNLPAFEGAFGKIAEIDIDSGVMFLNAQDLKEEIFDPIVKAIIELIRAQLEQAEICHTIFMVGGFGTSSYLFEHVREEFEGKGVKAVAMPPRAEMAIVKGAVYFGLDPHIITARVLRRTTSTETIYER
ncbi:hypothetical protein BZG36_00411 [Bifiguratus adelaidae]|uniref:Uncharacterized protein n=1 Tax=Bifiguratus adelaidae TaxID=1938954 RepID=A0A261Y8G9_9FUNG|nr:hypothetical protein BZG36_00411 [Bifiguratus adelaidae]